MSSFVLRLEREEPLTYFVEDIKEINYTACGYYLHRIKLLGLGNISSVKKKNKTVWTRDTTSQPSKWGNVKINLLSVTLSAKGRLHVTESFPQRHLRDCFPLCSILHCKLILFGTAGVFSTFFHEKPAVGRGSTFSVKTVSTGPTSLLHSCLTGDKWHFLSKIKSAFIYACRP